MKARTWTTWEAYLPSAKVQTRTGPAALCLKPWDQILPEEGIEERMGTREQLWRTWEKYLPLEKVDAAMHLKTGPGEEKPEKVLV